MIKKIGISLVFLLVMAAILSIRAHVADSLQTVIDPMRTGLSFKQVGGSHDQGSPAAEYWFGMVFHICGVISSIKENVVSETSSAWR